MLSKKSNTDLVDWAIQTIVASKGETLDILDGVRALLKEVFRLTEILEVNPPNNHADDKLNRVDLLR